LEPFNFEKSNISEGLWVAEGFTQYYGQLLMKRAGFDSDPGYLMQVGGLINAKENTLGGQNYSPLENSQRAVYADAGVSIDRNNYTNMFTSYYVYGGALALALDLQLRNNFHSSLDKFMQQMWKQFGKPEKPYTMPMMQGVLASVTSATFANDFFTKYVYGHQSIDYNTLLKPAGLALKREGEGKAWMGNRFSADNGELVVASNTIKGTPLYNAGIDVDDVLLQADGKPVSDFKSLNEIVAAHKPGDKIKLTYRHRTEVKETTVTFGENPVFSIYKLDDATPAQKDFYNNWVTSKSM